MELRHLRYFVAVAEECHFGRAAQRLFISQPPLSRQIQDLEEELGVRLLERSNHKVRLTDAGHQFLEGARLTLAQADRAASRARRAGQGKLGYLPLGYIPTADLSLLPRILRPFRERYPDVELELRSAGVADQIRELRSGRILAGFIRLPVREPGLRVEPLFREPLVVALPRRHPLLAHRRVPVRALSQEPFIVFPRPLAPAYYDFLLSILEKAGFTPTIAHEADSFQTHLSLVSAGLGVCLLPSSVQEISRSGVVYRPIRDPSPEVEIGVAYLEENPSTVLERFLGVVRASFEAGFPRRGPGAPGITGRAPKARLEG
jgi:DNA-binding transcriptional LysR family regulator